MCGIVAVLPGVPPERQSDLVPFVRELERLRVPPFNAWRDGAGSLEYVRHKLDTARRVLVQPKTEHRLLTDQPLAARVRSALTRIGHELDNTERRVHEPSAAMQRELIRLRAILWDLADDYTSRINAVADLLRNIGLGPWAVPGSAATGYAAIETALRSLDRIEQAAPKSTRLDVWVSGAPQTCSRAAGDGLASVSPAGNGLAFSYAVATANARPGDNVAALREAIARDSVLARALSGLDPEVSVLASTHAARCRAPRHVVKRTAQRRRHTTASQTEPPLTRLANALASVPHPRAVIAQGYQMPEALMLGVQGAGVSLHVGFAPIGWVVASEPHGVTGETRRFLRVAAPQSTEEARTGSLLTLSREGAGELAGLRRYDLDQTEHPVLPQEIESIANMCGS